MARPRKKPLPLEAEAKQFLEEKKPLQPPKPMTARRYFAAAALTGLLMRHTGAVRREDIKREANEWADYMLDDDA